MPTKGNKPQAQSFVVSPSETRRRTGGKNTISVQSGGRRIAQRLRALEARNAELERENAVLKEALRAANDAASISGSVPGALGESHPLIKGLRARERSPESSEMLRRGIARLRAQQAAEDEEQERRPGAVGAS